MVVGATTEIASMSDRPAPTSEAIEALVGIVCDFFSAHASQANLSLLSDLRECFAGSLT